MDSKNCRASDVLGNVVGCPEKATVGRFADCTDQPRDTAAARVDYCCSQRAADVVRDVKAPVLGSFVVGDAA
jgi:hypothetical protein